MMLAGAYLQCDHLIQSQRTFMTSQQDQTLTLQMKPPLGNPTCPVVRGKALKRPYEISKNALYDIIGKIGSLQLEQLPHDFGKICVLKNVEFCTV